MCTDQTVNLIDMFEKNGAKSKLSELLIKMSTGMKYTHENDTQRKASEILK